MASRINELINLERNYLASFAHLGLGLRNEEISKVFDRGVDVKLFSGIRQKIASFINQHRGFGTGYEMIWTLLKAKMDDDKALKAELEDILCLGGAIDEAGLNLIAREIKAINLGARL